jgi:hypothetical protein
MKIVIQARKEKTSIQASFEGQNLALEDFSEAPKTFLKVLLQKDTQVWKKEVPMIR